MALMVGACGDNITAGNIDANNHHTDGGGGDAPVDAGANDPMRAMTLAVTDVQLIDPEAAAVNGIRGGSILITFSDLTQAGGQVVGTGTSPIGGCVVTEYSPAHPPNPVLDATTVTIANEPPAEAPATGLLKTVGPCNFNAAFNQYICVSHAGASEAIVATNLPGPVPPGIIAYTMPAQTYPASPKMVGSYLIANGFTMAGFNSGASAFPVVDQNATNTLVAFNPAGEALTTDTAATGSFTVLNGFQPVPGAGVAASNFLGTGKVRVTKAADANWGAIDQVVGLVGEGFDLDPGSDNPANIPTADPPAAGLNFSCDNDTASTADDTCGDVMTPTSLTATIISGRATQQALTGLAPFQMPTEVPGTDTWREWQCAYLVSRSADLTQDALDQILGGGGFTPTRVEMRVLFVAGVISNGPNPGDDMTGRLLIGHGLVGHTDVP